MRARRLGRLALVLEQRRVEHVLHQRGLARAAHAGDAHQAIERDRDVDVLEVVLGGAEHVDGAGRPAATGLGATPASARLRPDRYSAVSVLRARQRRRACRRTRSCRRARRARAHVEDAIGLQHDLRIVLDHHQRVAGVAQPLHHVDHAPHVARMQADGRLVEHEQRVDQRGAERGGEVDALHLAARQRARLAVEREIAQPDLVEVGEARADLGEQQIGRLIQRRGQDAGVAKKSRQRSIGSSIRSCTVNPGSARNAASDTSRPCGRKRFSGGSTRSASSFVPRRHSSASGFSRAPSQAVHGV